jgi:hypothetical protein
MTSRGFGKMNYFVCLRSCILSPRADEFSEYIFEGQRGCRVHAFLIPLLKGLIAIFAVSGAGKLFLRFVGARNLPWYWKIAFTALAGQAVVTVLVEIVLLSGGGSIFNMGVIAWILVGLAAIGHVFLSWSGVARSISELFRADKIITAVLFLAVLTNLVVALAPSTKIDELHYHMLTSKRIVQDAGLRFYLLPIESAIVPQMHYQIALSVAHASGAPDAGNVLSWGFSIALSLFVMGFLTDATKNRQLSLLCGALCAVGIYETVWHTTGGAHALGDLATVVALAGVLRPSALFDALGPYRYIFLLTTAAAVAASTKLSLVPLSLITTALIVVCAIQRRTQGTKILSVVGLAFLPWIVLHVPLMAWTYASSGSPWGPVLANMFGHSVFPQNILQDLAELQSFSISNLFSMARYAVSGFSPVFFISILWILWTAFRGCKTSRLVAALFLFQGGIVAWKFHFDFRFFGGLEFVGALAAVLTLASSESGSTFADAWTRLGSRFANSRRWILLFAGVPWLMFQMYYARPFAEVVSGLIPRRQFLERYVALDHDFEMLNGILPRDSVLYMSGGRWPNFYAPRPVVLTPLDLHGRTTVFRLAPTSEPDVEQIDATVSLMCGDTVYQNDQAVTETYRTPGEAPTIGAIKVQRCQLQTSSIGR